MQIEYGSHKARLFLLNVLDKFLKFVELLLSVKKSRQFFLLLFVVVLIKNLQNNFHK